MLNISSSYRLYHTLFGVSIFLMLMGILDNSVPMQKEKFLLSGCIHGQHLVSNTFQIGKNVKDLVTKENIYVFTAFIVVLISFALTLFAHIQDKLGAASIENSESLINYDTIETDREKYIRAYEDAKQKVELLVAGVLSRANHDFATLNARQNIDFNSIIYNRIDFVEPRDIKLVRVRDILENIMSILHFKLIAKNINYSLKNIGSYEIKTDPILLEFMLLTIIQRVVEGLTIGREIHFKLQKNDEDNLELLIEDNGYEVDFFDFKLNTLLEIDVTSIKLLAYKLDSKISSESTAEKNLKKIILPLSLDDSKSDNDSDNVINLNSYRKNR